ncbi:caspase-1-like isoform X2 [Panulirus ornatus]|uniref:caspase-1-like isoform X2 n=1 Tax=Panulirus ornatus TaxID=150431 RepID=UPI003A891366
MVGMLTKWQRSMHWRLLLYLILHKMSESPDLANNSILDTSDALRQGFGYPIQDILNRPNAVMPVSYLSRSYNMEHKHRGLALIFVHDRFSLGGPPIRPCAKHDFSICMKAFKHLGFVVQDHWNLNKANFLLQLYKVSQQDHTDSDGLVLVFMSHGGLHGKTNKEFIWTYDAKVDTIELWKNFNAEKCPSLAGKPKMFFIQACRGEETDKGVCLKQPKALRVQADSQQTNIIEEYVIPENADMLMMWASYPGMYAFKSGNKGLNGSVFLHFLAQVLIEDAQDDDLASMLLRVTREVAIHYESYVPGDNILHKNKQIPYTASTLMRKVYFFPKK